MESGPEQGKGGSIRVVWGSKACVGSTKECRTTFTGSKGSRGASTPKKEDVDSSTRDGEQPRDASLKLVSGNGPGRVAAGRGKGGRLPSIPARREKKNATVIAEGERVADADC